MQQLGRWEQGLELTWIAIGDRGEIDMVGKKSLGD